MMVQKKSIDYSLIKKKISDKNKHLIEIFYEMLYAKNHNIVVTVRFGILFFDLHGWLLYVNVSQSDRLCDRLSLCFCQGIHLVNEVNPALAILFGGFDTKTKQIKKVIIESKDDIITFGIDALFDIAIDYNCKNPTNFFASRKK